MDTRERLICVGKRSGKTAKGAKVYAENAKKD
jgi:hypothetical protein